METDRPSGKEPRVTRVTAHVEQSVRQAVERYAADHEWTVSVAARRLLITGLKAEGYAPPGV